VPELDVNEVFSDPDFVDQNNCVCERAAPSVSGAGVATAAPRLVPFTAVVTNDSGDVLVREAEGDRVEGSINVVTPFRLTVGDESGDGADVVRFAGSRYTVKSVMDYSRYGEGFVEASCELVPLGGGA
jgi:hypothetical protein